MEGCYCELKETKPTCTFLVWLYRRRWRSRAFGPSGAEYTWTYSAWSTWWRPAKTLSVSQTTAAVWTAVSVGVYAIYTDTVLLVLSLAVLLSLLLTSTTITMFIIMVLILLVQFIMTISIVVLLLPLICSTTYEQNIQQTINNTSASIVKNCVYIVKTFSHVQQQVVPSSLFSV